MSTWSACRTFAKLAFSSTGISDFKSFSGGESESDHDSLQDLSESFCSSDESVDLDIETSEPEISPLIQWCCGLFPSTSPIVHYYCSFCHSRLVVLVWGNLFSQRHFMYLQRQVAIFMNLATCLLLLCDQSNVYNIFMKIHPYLIYF